MSSSTLEKITLLIEEEGYSLPYNQGREMIFKKKIKDEEINLIKIRKEEGKITEFSMAKSLGRHRSEMYLRETKLESIKNFDFIFDCTKYIIELEERNLICFGIYSPSESLGNELKKHTKYKDYCNCATFGGNAYILLSHHCETRFWKILNFQEAKIEEIAI